MLYINLVAKRASEKLGMECLELAPEDRSLSMSEVTLTLTASNSHIRKGGLSAFEVLTHCDQVSGEQLPVVDFTLEKLQHNCANFCQIKSPSLQLPT